MMESAASPKPKLRQSQFRAATPASRDLEVPSNITKGFRLTEQQKKGFRLGFRSLGRHQGRKVPGLSGLGSQIPGK